MNRSRTVGALPARPCGPTGSSGITVAFTTLSLSPGHVIHVFLTRSPLTYPPVTRWVSPFDLHALATPPAFVLSQDQTLQFFSLPSVPTKSGRSDTTKGFHSYVLKMKGLGPSISWRKLAAPMCTLCSSRVPAVNGIEASFSRPPPIGRGGGRLHILTTTNLFTCQRALPLLSSGGPFIITGLGWMSIARS